VTFTLLLFLQDFSRGVLRHDGTLIQYSKIMFILRVCSKYQIDQHTQAFAEAAP
jgi:hypothetical protein